MTDATVAAELIAQARQALELLSLDAERIARWAGIMARCVTSGGCVLAAGNGGSAAHAQHLTSELTGRFRCERPGLPAFCLTVDGSAVTAIGNDYGFDQIFARQVQALGRPGDVLLLFSTSGRSPNVLSAARVARQRAMHTLALTGPAPNPLAAHADDALCIDAPTTAAVQDAHQVALHALCAVLDQLVLDRLVLDLVPAEVPHGPRRRDR